MKKLVLDPCCGSKMFWFNKNNPIALFTDKRTESHILCDGRKLEITPDIEDDFTNLPFEDNSFYHVIFDPPHLKQLGKSSWMAKKKYGVLGFNWENEIKEGFSECFRVLKPGGTLIFKWNENQILVSDVLKLTPNKPMYGHRSGKMSNTHWIAFLKDITP